MQLKLALNERPLGQEPPRRRVHGLRQDHQPPVAISARDVAK